MLVTVVENVKARVAVSPEFAPMSMYTMVKIYLVFWFQNVAKISLLCWPEFSPQMVGTVMPVAT